MQSNRSVTLLLTHLPAWLYHRLLAEAERRAVGVSRIVGAALERELYHSDGETPERREVDQEAGIDGQGAA